MGEPSANQNSVAWNDWLGKISDSVRVVGHSERATKRRSGNYSREVLVLYRKRTGAKQLRKPWNAPRRFAFDTAT